MHLVRILYQELVLRLLKVKELRFVSVVYQESVLGLLKVMELRLVLVGRRASMCKVVSLAA
jgi:hypothetical protein